MVKQSICLFRISQRFPVLLTISICSHSEHLTEQELSIITFRTKQKKQIIHSYQSIYRTAMNLLATRNTIELLPIRFNHKKKPFFSLSLFLFFFVCNQFVLSRHNKTFSILKRICPLVHMIPTLCSFYSNCTHSKCDSHHWCYHQQICIS